MKTCALYLRISDDQSEGQGIKDQEARCRALALQHGLQVTHLLIDNDISASSYGKKERPNYSKLLELIRARSVDVVISDDQDRLVRRPSELETLMDTVGIDKARCQILTVRAGEHDFSTSSGRLTARIKGAVSAHESEIKSERIKDKVQAQVVEGLRQGGPRPYGWHRAPKTGPQPCPSCGEMMRMEPHGSRMRAVVEQCPIEAERIRTFAELKMQGVPLWQLASTANREQWPTASGLTGRWRAQTISQILNSPALRGERANKNGQPNRTAWDPILEQGEHDQVKSAIRTKYSKTATTPTLLGGLKLLRCGRCRSLLHASSPDRKGGQARYSCPPTAGGKSAGTPCGSCSGAQGPVEKRVIELLLNDLALYLQDPRRDGVSANNFKRLQAEEGEIDAALSRLTQDYYGVGSRLTKELFESQYDNLTTQLKEVQSSKNAIEFQEEAAHSLPAPGQDPQEWWNGQTLEQQRLTLQRLLTAIHLAPVGSHSGRSFRPERVSIDPKFGTTMRRSQLAEEPTDEEISEFLNTP